MTAINGAERAIVDIEPHQARSRRDPMEDPMTHADLATPATAGERAPPEVATIQSTTRSATRSPTRPVTHAQADAARVAAALLMAQFVCMWGAFFVLAPAIDWPASLDLPAAEMLPLLLERFGAVFSGYALYLAHAVLLVPVAVALHVALGLGGILGGTASAFGVLAGIAKALGIVRWLFVMPALAASWVAPGTSEATSEATRAAISVVFDALNAYAGGVGELMGVGLFAGLWTVLLSVALLRRGLRAVGLFGLVAAAGLFATLPSVVGLESPVLLTLSGVVWQLWTAALAVSLWRGARR